MFQRIYSILSWPTRAGSDLVRRIPAARRFDAWANTKEREWRRRRNRALVVALAEAGMAEQAVSLDEATR